MVIKRQRTRRAEDTLLTGAPHTEEESIENDIRDSLLFGPLPLVVQVGSPRTPRLSLLLVVQCAVLIGTSVNIVLRQERRRTGRRCAWHAVDGMGRYPDPAPLSLLASQLHDSSSSAVASLLEVEPTP